MWAPSIYKSLKIIRLSDLSYVCEHVDKRMERKKVQRFLASMLVTTGLAVAPNAANAQDVWVSIDQARPYDLKQAPASLVVGNPSFADVVILDGAKILVFGKTTGVTNVLAFDSDGKRIQELIVGVAGPRASFLTVNRGAEQFTYNCTHRCESTTMVGDEQEYFGRTAEQMETKTDHASQAAEAGAARDVGN